MPRVGNQSSNQGGSTRRSPIFHLIVPLLLVTLLAACGGGGDSDVQEDRRFATDPEPAPTEVPATVTPLPTPTAPAPTEPAVSASPEASPVPLRSTVSNVFALIDGAVVVADSAGGDSRVLAESTDERTFELIAPLPDGTGVGVIARKGTEAPWELLLISIDGKARSVRTDLAGILGSGKVGLNGGLAASWSPDGRRLAVVFPDGGGVVVHLDGTTQLLLTRGQAPAPLDVAWSPDGEAIAFTSRDLDDQSPYLAIGGARILPLDPVRIAGTGGQRPIHRITWSPDGEHLLVIQGAAGQPDGIGGDLIEIDRRTLVARFAVGGSRFGPGARVVVAEAAPDGQSWAIVTAAPGPSGGLEATVWKTAADFTGITRLDLGENPPVAGVIWTEGGLTVELHRAGDLVAATFDGDGRAITPATPEASPMPAEASPIAPPIVETATPVESSED